ncbi:MAG: DUF1631 family protein [Burkholderiales bacterium]|nr:DUF1631 family protein [Burkholderiales bacterium]
MLLPPTPHQSVYQATVQKATADASLLMGKLVAAARIHLQMREAACRDLRERDALAQSAKQLRSWEPQLCQRFPQALLDAFANLAAGRKAGVASVADVEFDELELMDEVQVLTSVTLARTLQVAMVAAEASLAELNTLICSTLGLVAVNPERNPLRPQIYLNALRETVQQTQVPAAIQLDWLGAMGVTLGQELRTLYLQLSQSLRSQGVESVGYAVLQSPGGHRVGRGASQNIPQASRGAPGPVTARRNGQDDTLLTLDRLRRLLAGELEDSQPLNPKEQFARQFAQQFESHGEPVADAATDFDATVPAALEALKEMEQVDAVVQRLQQRQRSKALPVIEGDPSVEAVRTGLGVRAQGLGQALSLEVIALMIDNIAQDPRLLAPVQDLIRRLEPPLLRLALVDARLFTHKQHPARVLVQEIADRSLAYAAVTAAGFTAFLRGVEKAVAPLATQTIDSAEPFVWALRALHETWQRANKTSERARAAAVRALQNAEQRNVLARKIAREIVIRPDAARVPDVVIEFLCGPWAQVIAQARIASDGGTVAAEKYQALVPALLWSTHPDLPRQNTNKLTRLLPRLLGILREGLDTILYPATRTSTFLESLMGFHQLAFNSAKKPTPVAAPQPDRLVAAARSHRVEDDDPWVAPGEAQASNFLDMPEAAQNATKTDGPTISDLPLGAWVELCVDGQWTRTQLTWASPHGTLYLFTNARGSTQSMSRRSRDRLVACGELRVISGQPLVDSALNAVAQLAMRNSVDTLI